MSDVEVMSVRAPSLEKLEKELTRLLAGSATDNVLGISHSAAPVSSKQSGGIWAKSTETQRVEYSALVLVRSA
jgi:hypothetical protein